MRADRSALVAPTVALGLLAVLAVVSPARANSQVAPGRELTRDDVLALTVHRAGSIVVGHMISQHDTTVQRGEHSGAVTFQKARFNPDRTLKGPALRGVLPFCWLPASELASHNRIGERSPDQVWTRGRFILFLHRPREDLEAPEHTYLGALQRTCAWIAIEESPGYYFDSRYPWNSSLEAEVRRAVARQAIDALIRRSDRIVLGRVRPHSGNRPAAGSHYNDAPRTIAVSRTLKGLHRARVDVQPVVPFWNQPDGWATEGKREFLWLLRRTRGGALEPVELLAGIVEVRNGRVPDWNMSLEDAVRRIQHGR
jgi:hypothetical protein